MPDGKDPIISKTLDKWALIFGYVFFVIILLWLVGLALGIFGGQTTETYATEKTKLKVSPIDSENWVVLEDFTLELINNSKKAQSITVPQAFVTDFTSVPRIFWSFIPRWGKYGQAAVVHDYLYATQACDKEDADKIFFFSMKKDGIVPNPVLRTLIFIAVYFGGYFAWWGNEADKTKGLPHSLPLKGNDPKTIAFPDNKTETWDEYRKKLKSNDINNFSSSSRIDPKFCSIFSIER